MKNVPIKHHYIPQFILRNFLNLKGFVQYFDLEKRKGRFVKPEDIFFTRNLYRQEDYDNPVEIEKSLSKYESEISPLFKDMISKEKQFQFTLDEVEKIKLFIAISSFRSLNARKCFNNINDKDFYTPYTKENETLEDLWKRNLYKIVNCRSVKEVLDNNDIDEPFKKFMMRDTFGLLGTYLVVCETRGEEKFVIGDCYPVVHSGVLENGGSIPMQALMPLSPNRVLIMVYEGSKYAPREAKLINDKCLRKPYSTGDYLKLNIGRIYQDDVRKINDITINNSLYGYIFNNEDNYY